MKAKYDLSKGTRGVVLPTTGKKESIIIRLDRDIVVWFRAKVEAQGGGRYPKVLNDARQKYVGM